MEAKDGRSNEHEPRDARPMKVVWMITERGDRSYWTRVGVGFVNRDGSITLSLDAMPVGAGKLQIRDYSPRDAEAGQAPDDLSSRPRHENGRGPRPSTGFAP